MDLCTWPSIRIRCKTKWNAILRDFVWKAAHTDVDKSRKFQEEANNTTYKYINRVWPYQPDVIVHLNKVVVNPTEKTNMKGAMSATGAVQVAHYKEEDSPYAHMGRQKEIETFDDIPLYTDQVNIDNIPEQ